MLRYFFLFGFIILHSQISAQYLKSPISYTYDLQFRTCSIEPNSQENLFNIRASIINSGLKTANKFSISIFIENGTDTLFQTAADQLLLKDEVDSLLTKDSIIINFNYTYSEKRTKKIIFLIDFSADMKPDNNVFISYFSNSFPPNSVKINEIMFNPSNNFPEYIELYNCTGDTIDLINWKIADQYLSSGKRNELVVTGNSKILPENYLTLAADSSIFDQFTYLKSFTNAYYLFNRSTLYLNNDEDEIVIFDLNGKKQDSLRYSDKWHNPRVSVSKGVSLEKIFPNLDSPNPKNWTSSLDVLGGTPSKANSALTSSRLNSKVISIEPNPFSPDGDGFEDNTMITYSNKSDYTSLRIRVFDKSGRLRRTILNCVHSLTSGNIQWDGYDDNARPLTTGVYILFIELLDDINGVIETYKLPVVIVRKL